MQRFRTVKIDKKTVKLQIVSALDDFIITFTIQARRHGVWGIGVELWHIVMRPCNGCMKYVRNFPGMNAVNREVQVLSMGWDMLTMHRQGYDQAFLFPLTGEVFMIEYPRSSSPLFFWCISGHHGVHDHSTRELYWSSPRFLANIKD